MAKHGAKIMKLAGGAADLKRAVRSPVDLHAVAGLEGEFEEGGMASGTHFGDERVEDAFAAGVTALGPQSPEDLHAGVGVLFEPGQNEVLVRVEFTSTLDFLFFTRLVALFFEPLSDGFDVESGARGDLLGQEVFLRVQAAQFMEGFKVDHRTPPSLRLASIIARRLTPGGSWKGAGDATVCLAEAGRGRGQGSSESMAST